MSDQIPSATDVEKVLIDREIEAQKKVQDPLDTHATMFFLYFPRFTSQLQFMSKKELIKLARTLSGSEHNKIEDINKIDAISKDINTNGVLRVITSVIEHPLQEVKFTLMSKKESKLFDLFDGLLTNKYYNSIKSNIEANNPEDKKVEIEDVIKHTFNKSEFKSRKHVEKDAFATANKLLASKYLMMLVTFLETAKDVKDEIKSIEENK